MGSSAEGFFGEHQGFEITTSLGTMPLKWQWFFHMAWGKKNNPGTTSANQEAIFKGKILDTLGRVP